MTLSCMLWLLNCTPAALEWRAACLLFRDAAHCAAGSLLSDVALPPQGVVQALRGADGLDQFLRRGLETVYPKKQAAEPFGDAMKCCWGSAAFGAGAADC